MSVALTRQMLWRMLGADHPMEAHRVDSRGILERGRSADSREGVMSFLEKRPAEFPLTVSADLPDIFPDYRSASSPDGSTMAAVTIRRGAPADRAGIAAVFRRASLHNDSDREELAAHPEVLEWDGQIDDGLVVAIIPAGQVVGFARVVEGATPDAAELEDLFVDPSWMRHGIATRAIARLVDEVVARGGGGSTSWPTRRRWLSTVRPASSTPGGRRPASHGRGG